MLVVDDGSADATAALVEARPEAQPGPDGEAPLLRVLRRPHAGKGAAVKAGVLAATADLVVFTDADMATPPDQIPLLTEQLLTHEVALGSRVQPDGSDRRTSQPAHRRLLGKIFRAVSGAWVTGDVPDTQCGFKGFRRDAGQDLFARQKVTSIVFDAEIIHLARRRAYRVAIVPVQWTDKRGSRMRVRPTLALRVLWDLFRIPLIHRGVPARSAARRDPALDPARRPGAPSGDPQAYTARARMTHPPTTPPPTAPAGLLVAFPTAFRDIPRAAWDRLLARTPTATPFSRWTLHAAWWDAYGATSHEQYLVCVPAAAAASPLADPDAIVGIVPLMHRHVVEPDDAATHTALRRRHEAGTDLRPDAKAVFMAASYHADYATILADPADLPAVADALVANLASAPDPGHGSVPRPWDVVDLRRWRHDDPALPIVEDAFRAAAPANGWEVRRELEDVCPVATLPAGGTWDDYLATLDKKARHEIRRKIRRAEAAGEVRFSLAPLDAETVDRFIALHQARWGTDGLFPDTEGGAAVPALPAPTDGAGGGRGPDGDAPAGPGARG